MARVAPLLALGLCFGTKFPMSGSRNLLELTPNANRGPDALAHAGALEHDGNQEEAAQGRRLRVRLSSDAPATGEEAQPRCARSLTRYKA